METGPRTYGRSPHADAGGVPGRGRSSRFTPGDQASLQAGVLAACERAATARVVVRPVRNTPAELCCGTRPRSPAVMPCSAPGRPTVLALLLILTLALFGLGFLNSLWWVAATVLVFVLLRHGRGGTGGRGKGSASEYREYRDYRDQQDRWDRRYSRSRRGRWNRRERRERGPHA